MSEDTKRYLMFLRNNMMERSEKGQKRKKMFSGIAVACILMTGMLGAFGIVAAVVLFILSKTQKENIKVVERCAKYLSYMLGEIRPAAGVPNYAHTNDAARNLQGAQPPDTVAFVPPEEQAQNLKEGEVSFAELCLISGSDMETVKNDLQWLKNNGGNILKVNARKKTVEIKDMNQPQPSAAQPAAKPQQPKTPKKQLTPLQQEGMDYLKMLEVMDERIYDEDISQKIRELSKEVSKLLTYGYNHAEDAEKILRFNRKYLNPVLKIMRHFQEIEAQLKESKIFDDTKAELLKTSDMLIEAYDMQLKGLYEEDMLDITSDVTVLENMLNQEGLLKNDNVMNIDDLQ